jgi:hypothetical protein
LSNRPLNVIAALLVALVSAAPAAANGPRISHFTLENGLQVVVIPDHSSSST